MTDEQIVIDGKLLGAVLRRNAARWIGQGMVAAAVLTGIGALAIPQSYTSTASVAVQAPQQAGNALSMLTGSGQTKRYIGILKSRSAALQVESAVHLQQMYNLPTREDALDMLGKALRPDDNTADGLLYVHVTLPGPPRLMPAAQRRDTVKKAAASAANAYVRVLRNFYLYNDTDREAALVRGANDELARMRTRYDVAFEHLRGFTNSLKKVDPRATPADSPEALATTTGLPKLYEALGVVETQISGLEAGTGTEQKMVAGQLGDVSHIPAEDPLLNSARSAVDNDRTALTLLESQYGPQNPNVVTMRSRLEVDQARLARQIAGIRDKQTTRQVGLQSQMESLRAKRDSLTKQIDEAEAHLNTGRRLSSDYLGAKTEWQLALAALTASETEVEKVRMENVSGQSRLTVIDNAVPAAKGSPSLGIIVAVSVFLAFAGIVVAFLRNYSRESRAIAPAAETVAA